MAKNYVISGRDNEQLQAMMRWYRQYKNILPESLNRYRRRRPTGGGGGGSSSSFVYKAFCKDDAGAATTIDCYLNSDVTPTVWAVDTAYTTASNVTGTDDKTYHCIKAHTSAAGNRPITGESWATYWEVREIEVNCSIAGGENLNAALPRLSNGDLIFVIKIATTWWCVTTFQATEDCGCYTE